MTYLFAYAGLLLHWLGQFKKATDKSDFIFRYFLKKNWYKIVFDAVSVVVLVYTKDDYKDIYAMNTLNAFALGYFVSSFFNLLVKSKKPRAKKIGYE